MADDPVNTWTPEQVEALPYNLSYGAACDQEMGYACRAAFAEVDALPPEDVRRLAAMALTCYDSAWSDRARDLLRGVASVVRRDERDEAGEDEDIDA